MINIVLIKNPFNVRDRDIKQVPYSVVKTLAGYIAELSLEEDIVVAVNGGVVPKEDWGKISLAPDSSVVICPVIGKGGSGKNVLTIIAGIALSVVSMGVGSAVAGGAMFGAGAAAMASWGFTSYLAMAAVMYVGGTLLNNMSSSVSIDDYSASTTYSWSTPTTQAKQGVPIPLTYGTVKVQSPNVLCAHITTDGDKQYLNLLLSGGEGPVTNIKDITIDGNPLANYDDVEVNLRYGTNDQAVIPNFADSYADQSLSYKLTTDDYATQRIDGNATEGIELTFEFPSGLFRSNDDGGLEETSVTIGMEYRKYGAADWLSFKTGSLKVTGSSSSAIRRVVRVDNLAQGQYEVRCKILNQDGTTNRYINTCYWTVVSSIVYDDFSYPNMVLVGIQALATDKLSGSSPNVTWKHTRAVVQVWNPNTASYEEKPATNAAWACYDLTHCCRKLKNINTGSYEYLVEGAPAGLILYDDFLAWASACDSRGLVCNYILDASGDMDAAWKPFEAAGRGKVVRRGTRYGCIYDHAADPVQMFSVGNIRSGTFSLDYLPIDDRANCVEITYNNEDKDHERDSMMVYGEDYDESDSVDNPTQITLDAITDPDRIFKEGKYYLRKNKYLIRTCTFEADVDAIACQVGDNILVQHDIPQWGFGGRIVSATTTQLKLDKELTLEAGKTYEITVRLQDDTLVKRSVVAPVETTTTDTITVSTPFEAVPAQYDIYSFGEYGISTKPFTVASITRTNDEVRKISALEYNEAVYTEATDVPVINYSQLDSEVAVTNLSLGQENFRQSDGSVMSNIYVSWTVARGKISASFEVFLSTDSGATYRLYAKTSEQSLVIPNVKELKTYYVKVAARLSYSSAAVASITIEGSVVAPPSDLAAFSVSFLNGKYIFSWKKAETGSEITGYEIRKGTTWDSGQLVTRAVGEDANYTDSQAILGTVKFFCKPYNGGGYSANALSDLIAIDSLPQIKTLYRQNNFEQLCSVSDSKGEIKEAFTYQKTDLTYDELAAMTYAEMLVGDIVGKPLGNTVLLSPIITLDVLAQAYISIKEYWMWPPDQATIYEIATSLDGVNFGGFKMLSPGKMPIKAFQVRITLAGVERPAILQHLDIEVNASQTTINYSGLVIPAGGLELIFSQSFANPPAVIVSPNVDALMVKKDDPTVTSCRIYLLSTAGVDIGGTADVVVVGI